MSALHRTDHRGVTLVEMLVVVGVITFLAAILLAALAAVRGSGTMTQSMNRMRQIGVWMRSYSTDNREFVLPSQFDYSGLDEQQKKGIKVRSDAGQPQGGQYQGSWADILWTVNEINSWPSDTEPDYRYDSPDRFLYEKLGGWAGNPLRSAASNSRPTPGSAPGDEPTPFGPGAHEPGLPGYFAANDFFNAAEGRWWSTGQIRAPARSMYLVDSYAGETIDDAPPPFGLGDSGGFGVPDEDVPDTGEVDFRYNAMCLMLFLDGHVEPVNRFDSLAELEGDPADPQDHGRGIRVRDLDRRNVQP